MKLRERGELLAIGAFVRARGAREPVAARANAIDPGGGVHRRLRELAEDADDHVPAGLNAGRVHDQAKGGQLRVREHPGTMRGVADVRGGPFRRKRRRGRLWSGAPGADQR